MLSVWKTKRMCLVQGFCNEWWLCFPIHLNYSDVFTLFIYLITSMAMNRCIMTFCEREWLYALCDLEPKPSRGTRRVRPPSIPTPHCQNLQEVRTRVPTCPQMTSNVLHSCLGWIKYCLTYTFLLPSTSIFKQGGTRKVKKMTLKVWSWLHEI